MPVTFDEQRARETQRIYETRYRDLPAENGKHDLTRLEAGSLRSGTSRLRDLTATLDEQTAELRQQVATNDEDAVLNELKRLYG